DPVCARRFLHALDQPLEERQPPGGPLAAPSEDRAQVVWDGCQLVRDGARAVLGEHRHAVGIERLGIADGDLFAHRLHQVADGALDVGLAAAQRLEACNAQIGGDSGGGVHAVIFSCAGPISGTSAARYLCAISSMRRWARTNSRARSPSIAASSG